MRQFFRTEVPLWAVITLILLLGGGMLAVFSYTGSKELDFSSDTRASDPLSGERVDIGNIEGLHYGDEPKLSDPDFFKKVKDNFISEKTSFIEADLSSMKIRVYKNGEMEKETSILTKGREGSWWETPAGLYKIESKEQNHFSSFGHVYQPWSMAFQGNFFIHGWPYYPDGKPVSSAYSGGCIRLADEDAKAIYDLVEKGTPVLVFEKDFEPDNFTYTRRSTTLSAQKFFSADLKNNFVFLQKGSSESIPLGGFGQFLGSLVAAEYINMEKQITLSEGMAGTDSEHLKVGDTVTPFDLLYLMLLGSSSKPLAVFEDILGAKRYAALINNKAAAVGMSSTHWDSFSRTSGVIQGNTSAEDLFYLSKYLYNNRNFLLKISAGKLTDSVYGVSQFRSLPNQNLFADDPQFVGGKYSPNSDGTGDFFGIFLVDVHGEKRPIFIFVGHSTNVPDDVAKMKSYLGSAFQ